MKSPAMNRGTLSTTNPAPRFVPLTVLDVIDETADARSFVFDIPADEREKFAYAAGQYCTFKVEIDGEHHLRCYSMSSSPDVDEVFRTTVKRVDGGTVSNHLIDTVGPGAVVLATPPAGRFCLDPDDDRPIVAFAGGSGITPVASIAKTALHATGRSVRLLFANRDADSVILGRELAAVAAAHPGRFELLHHHDDVAGFLGPDDIGRVLDGRRDAAVYLCGPTPFMDLVESTLADLGHDPALLRTERFVNADAATPAAPAPASTETAATIGELCLTLAGKTHTLEHHPGETVLEAARRGGLNPPFSCQAGNCATCIAELSEGEVTMRVNDVLSADEVAEGWILTCQSLPTTPSLTVTYPD